MKESRARFGIILFILSEAVFFLLLIIAYVTYHNRNGTGPTAATSLAVARTGLFSVLLFSSSGTMMLAEHGYRHGRRWRLRLGLAGTFLLGLGFLLGQGIEYAELLREHVTLSRDLFGTTFFTLTGFHGLHVAVGLLIILVVLGLALRRRWEPRPGAMGGLVVYWHFVDAVWIFIFGIVYLWGYV